MKVTPKRNYPFLLAATGLSIISIGLLDDIFSSQLSYLHIVLFFLAFTAVNASKTKLFPGSVPDNPADRDQA